MSEHILRDLDVAPAGAAGHEVAHQLRDVLHALAQRRQLDLHHPQAVQQVPAQVARVAVGRRDHAHVDRHRHVAADDVDHPLLQHAQQLGLQRRRQLGHLVEEQRAAVGLAEPARAVAHGPAEGPAHVAEQLRLEQLGRDRRAVDRHERPRVPRAAGVDPASDELLAGPALAGHEHRRGGPGHPIGEVERARHRRRVTDDRPLHPRDLALQPEQLGPHAPALERLGHREQQVLAMKRLADEVERARLHRRDREIDVAVGRDHQHRRLGRARGSPATPRARRRSAS
ncbi:hypothetical protein OV079_04280 [Nannocystis pusilla]|uniref:Uncharacterized protein n=1 Tax=Nannocystis pusilla TaxID=889268 RepID=A0A9X3EJG0_9BACT|nr:hypothetical protein [Nannocystis pusilla]MCY1004801.1 hypothetical protein [Nannocystis pusilla]